MCWLWYLLAYEARQHSEGRLFPSLAEAHFNQSRCNAEPAFRTHIADSRR